MEFAGGCVCGGTIRVESWPFALVDCHASIAAEAGRAPRGVGSVRRISRTKGEPRRFRTRIDSFLSMLRTHLFFEDSQIPRDRFHDCVAR